jgi:hypothetical protein
VQRLNDRRFEDRVDSLAPWGRHPYSFAENAEDSPQTQGCVRIGPMFGASVDRLPPADAEDGLFAEMVKGPPLASEIWRAGRLQ